MSLIPPYGDELVDLRVDAARVAELKAASREWPSWDLTPRQLCDLELLANGGFSPLRGFMTQADYERVVADMRLADGTLWPIPITLDVSEEVAAGLAPGTPLALRDPEGVVLAVAHVEDVYRPDRDAEARGVYGTSDVAHPGVRYLHEQAQPWQVGGRVEMLTLPVHYDFTELRRSPSELRADFLAAAHKRVVAFQTRNPMHRAHQELTLRAARETDAHLLLQPVVGLTKPGDVDHYTRVRCYEALLASYPPGMATLALLPLAMRMAGPREAVWHAIIRRNHGVTHFIVGRDHAGPGARPDGEPFYGPYDAQELLRRHEDEVGVAMVPFRMVTYVEDLDAYLPEDEVPEGASTQTISGTQLRAMLEAGENLPEWFTYPQVAEELRRRYPPLSDRGFTVFFTGLSGSGKSTIANALLVKLLEEGSRAVTLLDGDLVRKHLSSELGFSREHRDLNVRRIGFVAGEITKNGGAAICAPIAPYEQARRDVRELVESHGGFVLVHVATPLEVCEKRDRKGLYAKARAGVLKGFTGIDDPYEAPADAEVVIDASEVEPQEAVERILAHLRATGYLRARSQ